MTEVLDRAIVFFQKQAKICKIKKELSRLTDKELKHLGLKRSDIRHEAKKVINA